MDQAFERRRVGTRKLVSSMIEGVASFERRNAFKYTSCLMLGTFCFSFVDGVLLFLTHAFVLGRSRLCMASLS